MSAPFEARANFDSVGSPTTTYSDPRSANSSLAAFAPIESVSSPTTKRNAKSSMPRARRPLTRRDHRRDDAFRIACAAAVEEFVVLARGEPRRDGVDVRVEEDARSAAGRGQEVEPASA